VVPVWRPGAAPRPGPVPAALGWTTRLATILAAGLMLLATPLAAQEVHPEPAPQFDTGAPPALRRVVAPPPMDAAESLAGLLSRVLASDPQVRAAEALLQAAQERRLQARSRLGPSFLLTASNGQSQDLEYGLPVARQTDRLEAGLRWNLFNSGNDLAEFNASSRDTLAGEQDLRRAREDTSERVAESYVELLRLQELLPHARDRLAAVQRLVAQVQLQHEAGKASDADATQAEASLLDAQIALEQLQVDRDSAREKLAALVGSEVREVLPVVLAAVPPGALQTGQPGLVSAAQLRALSARDRVRPASSLLAPRIDLEMRHQLSDKTTPVQSTEAQHSWQLTARWEFPVMGETLARRNEGQRRAEAAEAEAERVARGVQADLQALRARIANAERSLAQLDQQVDQYDRLVRAGELQFEAGRRSVAQLIQLRDSRYSVEQRRAEQANRLLAARMRQLALTGQLLPALGLGSGADTTAP
jgi:outer membrane protein TolC